MWPSFRYILWFGLTARIEELKPNLFLKFYVPAQSTSLQGKIKYPQVLQTQLQLT